MTSLRMLPAMDVHQSNDEHELRYYPSKQRYPTEDSNDPFELFECPYQKDHQVTSKRWRIHLQKCKENYGGDYKECVYNASHHIPTPALEYHYRVCPDRDIIRQDIEGSTSNWKMSTTVNHNPRWNEPNTGECWDDEVDDNAVEFTIDVNKGMPLALKPQERKEEDYAEDGDDCGDSNASGEVIASVLLEELIKEKPSNWNEMTKTQKKNYKRKYDRQRLRMEEEGVTEEDFKSRGCRMNSESARRDKIAAVKAKFSSADDKMNASRVDFTSLLNIICQRCKINLPEYQACASPMGGFGYKCRVGQHWYQGNAFSSTKKDAKHDCAKEAIIGMEIPGIDVAAPEKTMPIHPRLLNQSAKMREGDELGKLMQAGAYAPKLRQPKVDLGGTNSQPRGDMNAGSPAKPRASLEDYLETQEDVLNEDFNGGHNSMEQYVQRNEQQPQKTSSLENYLELNEKPQQKVSSLEEYVQFNEQHQQKTSNLEQYVQWNEAPEQKTSNMEQYVQQKEQQPQKNVSNMEQYVQRNEQQQQKVSNMEQYLQSREQQQPKQKESPWSQPSQPSWGQPSQPSWGQPSQPSWGQPSQPSPNPQPVRHQQAQAIQPRPNPQPIRQQQPQTIQPQKAWGGWGAPSQKPTVNSTANSDSNGMQGVQNAMNTMSIANGTDFPSLGGSSDWPAVPKKPGFGKGPRGRGRGTTMKL